MTNLGLAPAGRRAGRLIALVLLIGTACGQDPALTKQRYLERGERFAREGKYNEAIIELKNAVQIDPAFAAARRALGRVYAAKAWHADAARELRIAVQARPDDVAARIDLGRELLALESWKDAEAEGEAIRRRDGGSAWGRYLTAAGLQGRGQSKEALELVDQALARDEPRPEFYRTRGDALAALDRLPEAERAYRAALARNPTDGDALAGLGALMFREGKREAAAQALVEARAANPASARVRLAISTLRAAEGRLVEAVK